MSLEANRGPCPPVQKKVVEQSQAPPPRVPDSGMSPSLGRLSPCHPDPASGCRDPWHPGMGVL